MSGRIGIRELRIGMLTPEWEVLSAPAPLAWKDGTPGYGVEVRHRIDGGTTTMWYDAEATVEVVGTVGQDVVESN